MSVLEMRQHWPRLVAHSLALIPLLVLGLQAATGTLPFNVWRYLMLQSGLIGMVLLLISFACTPLTTITGWRGWIVMRRPFGVYGFLYALAHLLVYAIYDGALDPALIWRDLGERRSMAIGLVALALLVPLAVTSTDGWQRRLGSRWRSIHRLVYLALPLSVLHYFWLERDIIIGAQIAAAILGLLLLLRLPTLRRQITRLRQRMARRQ